MNNKIVSGLIVFCFILISFSVMVNNSYGVSSTNASGNSNLPISLNYNNYYSGYTYSSVNIPYQNNEWNNQVIVSNYASSPTYNIKFNNNTISNILNTVTINLPSGTNKELENYSLNSQITFNSTINLRNSNNFANISINLPKLNASFKVSNYFTATDFLTAGIFFPQYNILYYYSSNGWNSYSTNNYVLDSNWNIFSTKSFAASVLSINPSNLYLVANSNSVVLSNATISNIGSITLTNNILEYSIIVHAYQSNYANLGESSSGSLIIYLSASTNLSLSQFPSYVEFTQFPLGWSQQPEFAPFSTSYAYRNGEGLYWNNTSSSAILSLISMYISVGTTDINYIYYNYTTNNQIYFNINIEYNGYGWFDLDLINNIGITEIVAPSKGTAYSANITYNSFNNVNAVISGAALFSGYPYTGKFQGEVLRYGATGYIEWNKALPFYNIVYYNLSFTEANLASGTLWTTTVNGIQKIASAGQPIYYEISTGKFSIETQASGYTIFNTNLTMYITGVTATYSRILNFTNSKFINLWVNTTGLGSSIANLYISGSVFYITGNTELRITNGTQSLALKNPFGYTNNLTITQANYQNNVSHLDIGFTYVAKSLTVNEIGLRSSLVWTVSFNNTLKSINTNSVSFIEMPSTYALSVSPINNYSIVPYSTSINLASNTSITIQFEYLIHTLTLKINGLNNNIIYDFTINGKTYNFNQNTETLLLANGTYNWTLSTPSGYLLNQTSGQVIIAPSNTITVSASSIHYYKVTFISNINEGELYLFINGNEYKTNLASSNIINASLVNGTYTTSYSLSNYSIINYPTVTVVVNGQNETVYLTFSKNPVNSNFIIDNLPYISVFMIISTLLLIAIGIRYSRRE